MTTLKERVIAHIPRCLSNVSVNVIDEMGATQNAYPEKTTVRFGLSNGEETSAKIVGYDLRNYNSRYEGPIIFISPIILQWQPSQKQTLIFDSDIHGYHGEMDASAKLRGSGNPTVFQCSQCGNESFTTSAQFEYGGGAYDLWDDEPEIDIENYFQWFTLIGFCPTCRQQVDVISMD